MGESAMAQKAKDLILEIIDDDTMTDTDKMHLLNYLKAFAEATLLEVLNFYEQGEDEDGR